VYTAIYSSQSYASERVNRSLIPAIRAYLKSDQREWNLKFTQSAVAYEMVITQDSEYLHTMPYMVWI